MELYPLQKLPLTLPRKLLLELSLLWVSASSASLCSGSLVPDARVNLINPVLLSPCHQRRNRLLLSMCGIVVVVWLCSWRVEDSEEPLNALP